MARARVIGYGICGPGEAGRFMRETLEDFKRLCDETLILCNNAGPAEKALCYEYGVRMVQDNREWGKLQWRIKQDFVERHVAPITSAGDVMVCLDMDERFDRHLTREWLLAMPFDAYKVFIVDLWNDPEHYKPASCFWNTRIWRWTGNTEWIAKPVHCGLAPRWAVAYNRHAPFLLIHKGLMLREDRQRKIARYEKYDPHAQHLAKPYYAMLHSDTAEAFDEEALHAIIESEVSSYKQSRPRATPTMAQPKGRFAYVQNPGGLTVDIPEKQLAETLARKGFVFIGWADEAEDELEQMFAEGEVPELDNPEGSYHRPMADEKAEVDALEAEAEAAFDEETPRDAAENLPRTPVTIGPFEHVARDDMPVGELPTGPDEPVLKNRLGIKQADTLREAAKRAPAKKAAKKKAK